MLNLLTVEIGANDAWERLVFYRWEWEARSSLEHTTALQVVIFEDEARPKVDDVDAGGTEIRSDVTGKGAGCDDIQRVSLKLTLLNSSHR